MFRQEVYRENRFRSFVACWLQAFSAELRLVASCPWSCLWLAGVLCVDAYLFGLDSAFRYAVLDGTELPNWFNLSQERGLGEIFEHFSLGSGAIALGLLAARTRSRPAMMVTVLMAWVMGDNLFEFHEASGKVIGRYLPHVLPVEPGQEGEIVYLVLLAAITLAAVAASLRGKAGNVEAGSLAVVGCILFAGGFGVFVDALHASFEPHSFMEVILAGTEDGGELVGLSLAGGLSVALLLAHGRRARDMAAAGSKACESKAPRIEMTKTARPVADGR